MHDSKSDVETFIVKLIPLVGNSHDVKFKQFPVLAYILLIFFITTA